MMISKIIKSTKTQKKNPFIAFSLSLIFTGLGQIYNGDIVKGFVLFTIRCLSLLMIPLYVIVNQSDTYIDIFILLSFTSLLLIALSPIESLIYSLKNRTIPVKRYNSILFYIFFCIINILISLLIIFTIFTFFKITKVIDQNHGPLLDTGEYILIKKYSPVELHKGELVEYNNHLIGRIMAKEGDSVKYLNNIFYINNRALPLGHIRDDEIKKLTDFYCGDIISEKNNNREYPIRFKKSASKSLKNIKIKVNKDSLLVVSDCRLKENIIKIIKPSSINGRIEGIIFSRKIKKIGLSPYISNTLK